MMTHILPKIQFLREQYITLNEGFDRVGRTMFPRDWTGLEALAWPEDGPQSLWDEKQNLKDEFDFRSQRARRIRLTDVDGMEKEEYAEHQEHLERLEAERRDASEKLDQFGRTYDFRISDASLFDRRKKVEYRLCKLIQKEELDVRLKDGFGVRMEQYFRSDGFHISFAYSYIITPRPHGRRRRVPAYFIKSDFNRWILPFERELQQYDMSPIEEQMLEWFRGFRDHCLFESRKITQAQALEECEKHFGKIELASKFEAVWKLLSVKEMRKIGRPKKNP